ncbi:AfsR/SARP family transcriptional regulator [Kribbella catacumbae]|uniref:AfsR/SARP family transcriptional regulator n=1 Tax=Kribbella catacumbae TaxID=460086 RepID=UPI0003644AE7|nr:BTAD domain-containing putative transcriptional regulator [Kribbella catacumbae]
MEIQLLGAVEVTADGVGLDVGSPKQRLVLAALAATPGQVVPLDVLIDRVWGEDPPARPAATLYPYLSQLRGMLYASGPRIVRRAGGYACEVAPECVDVVRFRDRLRAAKAADTAASVELLGEALSLWRGVPLAGLSGDWVIRFRDTLSQERLSAWLLLARHRLESGDLASLVDGLRAVAGDYPLSEPLAGYVIRALIVDGRRLEALDYYAKLREYLADQLGEEPGDDLRDLHLRLLRRDPGLGAASAQGESVRVVPRQLPASTRCFTGRERELGVLDELIGSSENATAVVISAIAGTAGIGKTATALHWAHRVADQFPDGQLFVNLRGFDPGAEPLSAIDAVRGFLETLGTSPGDIPQQQDAQIAMFRSLLAKRRMLVLLDNARDVDQVRPLLPGAPGSLVLVTSRNRLTGLVAEHGAHSIHLDLLSGPDAEQLLRERLGADRLAAEPAATTELVQHCARLPLALAIVAGRAAVDRYVSLAAIAADLADKRKRLDALDTHDRRTTLRAVFVSSYNALAPPGQRLFRLLGVHPGPDISVAAAASLAGVTRPAVTRLLGELCYASMLIECAPGRYTFHDLLRAYATDLSVAEPDQSAIHRVLDHYLHTAHAAERILAPHRDPATPAACQPDVLPEDPGDAGPALAWFAAEHRVLLATVDLAAKSGFDLHVTQLVEAFATFLDQQGRWHDWITMEYASLAAAQRLGNRPAEGLARRGLGLAYSRLDRFTEATAALEGALNLYRAAGDHGGEAKTCLILAHHLGRQNRYAEALEHSSRALVLQTAVGNRTGQGRALSNMAWHNAKLGNFQQAISDGERSIALLEEVGDRKGQGATWDTLGYVHHQLGNHQRAHACYRYALDLWRQIGHGYFEVSSLTDLGETQLAAGDRDAARRTWQQALNVLDSLDHVAVGQARTKLLDRMTATDQPAPGTST